MAGTQEVPPAPPAGPEPLNLEEDSSFSRGLETHKVLFQADLVPYTSNGKAAQSLVSRSPRCVRALGVSSQKKERMD